MAFDPTAQEEEEVMVEEEIEEDEEDEGEPENQTEVASTGKGEAVGARGVLRKWYSST